MASLFSLYEDSRFPDWPLCSKINSHPAPCDLCSCLGKRLHLPPVHLLHLTAARGHIWGAGRVRLDRLLRGDHTSPWLRGLPGHGGGNDGWFLHWLGEKERSDSQRDGWPQWSAHQTAAQRQWSPGEAKKHRAVLFLFLIIHQTKRVTNLAWLLHLELNYLMHHLHQQEVPGLFWIHQMIQRLRQFCLFVSKAVQWLARIHPANCFVTDQDVICLLKCAKGKATPKTAWSSRERDKTFLSFFFDFEECRKN